MSNGRKREREKEMGGGNVQRMNERKNNLEKDDVR